MDTGFLLFYSFYPSFNLKKRRKERDANGKKVGDMRFLQ
jgi:hypothetical protein